MNVERLASERGGERRVTVPEAAEILGISPEAVRARMNRGTLKREKGDDGTAYVRLNADHTRTNADRTNDRTLLDGSRHRVDGGPDVVHQLMQDQIDYLRK
jgi:predicted ArsR family transcriptional regulator